MTTTAEAYGFGARAQYATPRASEHDMKERVRLSGLFPRVGNEPMSKQLQGLRAKRCLDRYTGEAPPLGGENAIRVARPGGYGRAHSKPSTPPSRWDGRCRDERSSGCANRRSAGRASAAAAADAAAR